MTGPYKGGTGGAGWGGAFAAVGDATSNYFDKLDTYNKQAEQKRQFDANLAANKQQLAMQEQRLKMEQYDKFDQGIDTLRTYWQQNAKYMTPEDNEAMGQMVQRGDAASMAFWASRDETGLQEHATKYGPGKAWGTDPTGMPINWDTISSKVNQRKPIIDMQDKIRGTYGETAASMLSSALLDPASPLKDNAEQFASMLLGGAFANDPGKAFAAMFAGNTMGPKMLLSVVQKAGFTPESLAIAEDSLKMLPKAAYTAKDDKGADVVAPEYEALQNFIADNRTAIDAFRQGREIQQGKGTVLQYNAQSFALDADKWNFSRSQIQAGKADVADIGRLVNEGDVATLSQPAAKQEYARVFRIGQPNATDQEIDAAYRKDLARAEIVDGQRKSMAAAQVSITNNQALQSQIETDQKEILFNAVKPYLAGDAVAERNLQDLLRRNNVTQAQFLSTVLPQMLRLQNDKDKVGLLKDIASAEGGIGIPAIQAMIDGKLIGEEDGKALMDYAQTAKTLWKKGVNVQTITLSADYMTAALRKQSADAMIQFKVPTKEAEAAANNAVAAGVEALNKGLIARGMTPFAGQLGSSAARAQISQNDATAITADVQAAVQRALQAQGVPALQAEATAQTLSTQIATGLVQQATAQAQLPLAGKVATSAQDTQLSSDALVRLNNTLQTSVTTAMLPYAAQIGDATAQAQLQGQVTAKAQSMVQQYLAEGGLPFARRAGASGMQTQLSTDALTRITNDVQQAIQSGQLPLAAQIGEAQAKQVLQTAITTALQQYYNGELTEGQLPYAGQLGNLTGQANVAEQNLRLATINNTIDLLPMQSRAQRQQYATAIASGKADEALAILKANNVNFDYAMGQASTVQALASLDPKGQLASQIKNPSNRAMYLNAVSLSNQQRDLVNQINQNKTGGARGTKPSDIRSAVISVEGQINGILKSNEVKDAQRIIQDLTHSTVAVDPVTGMFKIVQPANVNPADAAKVQAAYGVLQSANDAAAPLIAQRNSLVSQQIAAVQGSGVKTVEQADTLSSLSTPGTNLSKMGFTSDAITAAPGLSNCSMFARQATAKLLGVNAYGNEMQKYFGANAGVTLNNFRSQKAIYADNMTPTAAAGKLGNLKAGDTIFLYYGNPSLNHVAIYDGNGKIIQHSYPNFRGQQIQGNVNTMGIEEFLNKAGKGAVVSFGRVPGIAGDKSVGTSSKAAKTGAPNTLLPPTPGMMPAIKGNPRFRATSVAPGMADPKLGRVIPAASGAAQKFSGLGTAEITKQINSTADFMINKAKEVNSSSAWDNQSGFLRGYVGFGNSPANANYVSNVRATFGAKPWLQAIQQATGSRKDELIYINTQAERIAKAKGIEPNLLKALMWNESEWVPGARRTDGKGGGMGQVEGYFPPAPNSQKPAAQAAPTATLKPVNYSTATTALPSLRPLGQQREQALQWVIQAAPGLRTIKDRNTARTAIQALTEQVFGTKNQQNIPEQKKAAMNQFAKELAIYLYGG